MRFAATTFIWTSTFTDADLPVVARVAELGFDAIEVALGAPSDVDPARLREALEREGLGCVVLSYCLPESDVSAENAAVRESGLDRIRAAVDFASAVGAPVVGGPILHPPGRARFLAPEERARERARAVESLRVLGDYAGERSVALAVEQLSRFDSDLVNTAADAVAFCEEVGCDAVGVLLDTFHMHIEEDSLATAIRAASGRLQHLHASENHRGQPGTGQVDWRGAAEALSSVGYDGVVSIESFSPTDTMIAGLVSMWRPWFEDPDEFARNALAFLRTTFEEAARSAA